MKRQLVFALVGLALAVNLGVGARVYMSAPKLTDGDEDTRTNLELFNEVIQKIRTDYVDGKDLTSQQLVYSALRGAVSKLDPHSEFLDADSYQDLQDDTEGQFGGLGLVVQMKNGFMTVVAPMDDSPGLRAGILAGDRIVQVEGTNIEKQILTDVVKQLRGPAGSVVSLTVYRPSTKVTKTYQLKRAVIQMAMVKDLDGKRNFPLLTNGVGYVQILQFGEKTGAELQTALDKLKSQGMKGLIIDLRWNPGGLLDEAVEVCEKFLPKGSLVVSTEGRRAVEKYAAEGSGDELPGLPIVVLVNLDTASAAEIVTGCLQDYHRAVVLGEKTFGKGSVQTIFPFDDGSALKLTVAKYYTPSHKVIHQKGITPDILVPVTDAEEAAQILKREPGGADSLPDAERKHVEGMADQQLERAEDLLKGLILYQKLVHVPGTQKMAEK